MRKIQHSNSLVFANVLLVLIFGAGCSSDSRPADDEAFIPTELHLRIQSAGAYDSDLVKELEEIKQNFSDPRKRAVVDLVILSQNNIPGAQMAPDDVRRSFDKITKAYPGTWISAAARVGIAVNLGSFDPYEDRVNAWLDALQDPGLPGFRDGDDPLLRSLAQHNASENAKDVEDIILNQLIYLYTTAFDLESATDALNKFNLKHGEIVPQATLNGCGKWTLMTLSNGDVGFSNGWRRKKTGK